jgi:glycosyltransferase involved in cell wall biosynthesis
MRILFVAMAYSVHTARYIDQIADEGWDLHLVCSRDSGRVHPLLRGVTVHHSAYHVDAHHSDFNPHVKQRGALGFNVPLLNHRLHRPLDILARGTRRALRTYRPAYQAANLAQLIRRLKPDFVHAIEFQAGAYLVLEARDRLLAEGHEFPAFIATNLGPDLYYYRHLDGHKTKIDQLLQVIDYYDCECARDVALARELGLQTENIWPVTPNPGGFDLDRLHKLRSSKPPSTRKIIMIKGYQTRWGRALFALRAIRQCADLIQELGYRIVIFGTHADVDLTAQILRDQTGLDIEILPPDLPHENILHWFGQARTSIGVSMSDAASISMLEAMSMAAFPIQSYTACADEWFTHGETGLIVDPEDPNDIEAALRRAITDDALVDAAAERNLATARARLDREKIKRTIIDQYKRAYATLKPSR